MKAVLLAVVVLLAFVLGYFIMGRLDKFLANSFRTNREAAEAREPSCVMLPDGLTDEEILLEIRRFRERHSQTTIILSDGEGDPCPACGADGNHGRSVL